MDDAATVAAALDYLRRRNETDPVHWYVLAAPDGSEAGDIVEMHASEAARRNESRMAAYMASEKRRNEKRNAWKEKRESEARFNSILQQEQASVAARAQGADVPIPENASGIVRQLVADRKSSSSPGEVPILLPEPEPEIAYTSADFLWTRTLNVRGRVIRVEGTRRGKHD